MDKKELNKVIKEIAEMTEMNPEVMEKLKVIKEGYTKPVEDTKKLDAMTEKYNKLKEEYMARFFGGEEAEQEEEVINEEKEENGRETSITIDDLFTEDDKK